MKGIAATARHEVNLHARLTEPLIHIKLFGLHSHLFDAFEPGSHGRR